MKTKYALLCELVLAGGILFATLAAAPVYSQEPRSYPLVCRGGGEGSYVLGLFSDRPPSLRIEFQGARVGASSRPPAPGQCAWLDRGWRAGEGNSLYWYVGEVGGGAYLRFSSDNRIKEVQIARRSAPGPAGLKYLLEALRNGTLFQVYVYRLSDSEFRVTRVGP